MNAEQVAVPVLVLEGVSKAYPGTLALCDADWQLHAGAINVLVGENGAGKSTMMKIIAGVEQPTRGCILLDGAQVSLPSPEEARRHGIGIVFQELNLFPSLTIVENLFAGREIRRAGALIDTARQRARARQVLVLLEHKLDPDLPVRELRVGQQQVVEIAKALVCDTRILILDEPTSALSAPEVEVLFMVIAGLALVPEDRRTDGLVHTSSIGGNLSLASLRRLATAGRLGRWLCGWAGSWIGAGRERAAVNDQVRSMTIKTQDLALPIGSLSGGNQQKVVIGRALLTGPRVLLLDEPSRGIDIGAKAEVFGVMRDLAAQGMAVLFVSSDLQEVMALADRIVVMSNGRVNKPQSVQNMNPTPPTTVSAAAWRDGAVMTLLRARTFIALIAVTLYFSLAAPNFISADNAIIVAKHVALNAFLAIGMTYVIVSGGIDLSVGSIVGLTGMVAGALILHGLPIGAYVLWFNAVEVIFIALALGIAIGALNGWLITRLNVAPFIATLGTLYIARGSALLASDGATFPNLEGNAAHGTTGFPLFGTATMLGVPLTIWLLVALAIGAAALAARTPLGRHI